jgi:hypothetical protein
MQKWLNFRKSINVVHNVKRLKAKPKKNYRLMFNDTEKLFHNIQHPPMIKKELVSGNQK